MTTAAGAARLRPSRKFTRKEMKINLAPMRLTHSRYLVMLALWGRDSV